MNCPGHHTIDKIFIDHQCSEIVGIGYRVAGHFFGDTLVFAKLIIGLCKIAEPIGCLRIDYLNGVQMEPQAADFIFNFLWVAEQGDIDDTPAYKDFRGAQDALFSSFRQHNVPAPGFGSFNQFIFEHNGSDLLGAHYLYTGLELARIDVGFKNSQGGGNFAVVFGSERRTDGRCIHGRGVGIGIDLDHRNR